MGIRMWANGTGRKRRVGLEQSAGQDPSAAPSATGAVEVGHVIGSPDAAEGAAELAPLHGGVIRDLRDATKLRSWRKKATPTRRGRGHYATKRAHAPMVARGAMDFFAMPCNSAVQRESCGWRTRCRTPTPRPLTCQVQAGIAMHGRRGELRAPDAVRHYMGYAKESWRHTASERGEVARHGNN